MAYYLFLSYYDISFICNLICSLKYISPTPNKGATTFLCLHSYDIFLKASKLNVILMNSSHLIFFKTAHDARAAKRLMGQYMLNLKGGQTLFDDYKRQVLEKNFSYILVALSPLSTKPSVWSQVLLAEECPMLCFNESSDSEGE